MYKMIKIIIPARGGSKRIPRKNLADLNGKPLISYAIENSLRVTKEVYVSTDCPKIEDVSIRYGAKIIRRPAAICTDFCKTNSAIEHFLNTVSDVNFFACVQATTPLMEWTYLKKGFDKIQSYEFDSVLSVCESKKFYWTADGEPVNFSIGDRLRTQDMKKHYEENGAFYITNKEQFLMNNSLMGGKVGFIETPHIISLEIDDLQDLKIINAIQKVSMVQ
jgi:CMP-N,N'-diacetyllegionaminic acid synthase